jgi:hypothetical protein
MRARFWEHINLTDDCGNEELRRNPKEVIEAMVSIVPADTGLFRNVVPKALEEFVKADEKEAWERCAQPGRGMNTRPFSWRPSILGLSLILAIPTTWRSLKNSTGGPSESDLEITATLGRIPGLSS